MTVETTKSRIEYSANGAMTSFTVDFKFFDEADLDVYVNGNLMSLGTDYSVTGAGDDDGGNVIFSVAPLVGWPVIIVRETGTTRKVVYPFEGPIKSDTMNNDFDRLTLVSQELSARLDRKIGLDDSVSGVGSLTLPKGDAFKIVGWNGDGSALINVDRFDAGGVTPATTVSAGITRYATLAETQAGTASTGAITADSIIASSSNKGIISVATSANVLSLSNAGAITPSALGTALSEVVLTDAATVTPDFSAGLSFKWTLGAVGRTLANPTNAKVGTSGYIRLIQDATGGRTITTWGNAWVFANGEKPVLSTAANAEDVLFFKVLSSTRILGSLVSNLG